MVRAPSASNFSSSSISIQRRQSSPPITAMVSAISASLAGASVTGTTFSESSSTVLFVKGAPTGFSAEECVAPVSGCVRLGEARL